MPIMDKVRCDECGWVGMVKDILEAPNPFASRFIIQGCPNCFEINKIVRGCFYDDCSNPVSGGMPTKKGYRFYCHEHIPE